MWGPEIRCEVAIKLAHNNRWNVDPGFQLVVGEGKGMLQVN